MKIYDVLNIQMEINCFLAAAQSQSLLIVDWQIDFFSFCSTPAQLIHSTHPDNLPELFTFNEAD